MSAPLLKESLNESNLPQGLRGVKQNPLKEKGFLLVIESALLRAYLKNRVFLVIKKGDTA